MARGSGGHVLPGVSAMITMSANKPVPKCSDCGGLGSRKSKCSECFSDHWAFCSQCDGAGFPSCSECEGSGHKDGFCDWCRDYHHSPCAFCEGTGLDEESVDVRELKQRLGPAPGTHGAMVAGRFTA